MKKIILGLIAVILALSASLVITNISQPHELTCLKLYKEWSDFEDWEAIQLAERDASIKKAKMLIKYVEMDCPEFRDLETHHTAAKNILENYQ